MNPNSNSSSFKIIKRKLSINLHVNFTSKNKKFLNLSVLFVIISIIQYYCILLFYSSLRPCFIPYHPNKPEQQQQLKLKQQDKNIT